MIHISIEEQTATQHRQNQIRSELLLRSLRRHHYDLAPKAYKDKHLPVLHASSGAPINHTPTVEQMAAPEFSMEGFEAPLARPLHTVLAVVAHYYRKQKWQILGFRRTGDLIRPRHVAMLLATEFSDLSVGQISRFFNRDHTVVLYAVESITSKMQSDDVLALQVDTMRKQIQTMSNIPDVDHVARMRLMASTKAKRGRATVSQ